jgi:hypothetical protein
MLMETSMLKETMIMMRMREIMTRRRKILIHPHTPNTEVDLQILAIFLFQMVFLGLPDSQELVRAVNSTRIPQSC